MPTIPEALTLARQLLLRGDPRQAEIVVRDVLRAEPGRVEALLLLASAQRGLCQLDQAAATYRDVLVSRSDVAEIHLELGNVLLQQNRLDEAAAAYRAALMRRPDFPAALTNLGTVFQTQGRLAQAEACHRQALAGGVFDDALYNLGNVVWEQERDAEAIDCFREVLRRRPNHAGTHLNLAMALLRSGQFAEGWREYEWRFACGQPVPRFTDRPRWDGTAAPGRTILVHSEQGFGDVLMFSRYVPLVQQTGARVIFEVPSALLRLLERGPKGDELLPWDVPPPEFDRQISLLSLPKILGTTLETIAANVPYLEPEPERLAHWQAKLEPIRAFKIGIGWQGDPSYRWDHLRSIPLAQFAPLAAIDGVQLFSLQKGPGTEQLAKMTHWFAVNDLGGRLDEDAGPFMDTAAIMRQLDLVITCDSALAHLAGALGVPVWLLLSTSPEWRWLLQRDDSPWYPTMRLFRQRQPGAWGEVFSRLATSLREKLGS